MLAIESERITRRNCHKVSQAHKSDCLNCPFAECVHTPAGAIPGNVCPIDGYTVAPKWGRLDEDRQATLSEIKRLLGEMDFPGLTRIAREVGVAPSTLHVWGSKGYLKVEKVQSPYGRKGQRLTIVKEVL